MNIVNDFLKLCCIRRGLILHYLSTLLGPTNPPEPPRFGQKPKHKWCFFKPSLSYLLYYPFIKGGHCSPNLTNDMKVERDEDHQRNDEDDDCDPSKINLMPERWPAGEVADTLWLQGTINL